MSILSEIIKAKIDPSLSADDINFLEEAFSSQISNIDVEDNSQTVSCDNSEGNSDNPNSVPEPRTSTMKTPLFELEEELCKNNDFIVTNGLLYHYNPKVKYYELVNQDDVIFLYRSTVDPDLNGATTLGKYKDLYKFLKTDPKLNKGNLSNHETYFPLKDNIYYFTDGECCRKSHGPENYTFTCLDASFDENLNIPTFARFVYDITGGKQDLIDRLLMALGYLLLETEKGKFFFLAGFKPDTGKSVLFNFIQRLFPPEAVSNLPIGDLGGRFESESLLTSRINISLDLPQEPLSSSAIAKIKQITGGDTVEIQRKNKTSKKLDHPVKLVFASNHPIALKNDDKAFWNRLIFLPFTNPVKDKDPELGNKLWDERNGIVTLLLIAVQQLESLNYEFPQIEDYTLKKYGYVYKSTETYIFDFIQERCISGNEKDFCPVAVIWREFKNYQETNPGPHCTHTEFNKFMECHGYYRVHKSDVRGFSGIQVRVDLLNKAKEQGML